MTAVLAGRVAIVTGGGGGIGSAIARLFTGSGARIAFIDLQPPVAVVAALPPGQALALAADVSSEADTLAAVARVVPSGAGSTC